MVVIKIENYFHIIQSLGIIKKNSQVPTHQKLIFKVKKRASIHCILKSLFHYILHASEVSF